MGSDEVISAQDCFVTLEFTLIGAMYEIFRELTEGSEFSPAVE
jgi:hypothetical protein